MNIKNAKEYFINRKFSTRWFLESLEKYPDIIDLKSMISPKHFSYLDESMIEHILKKGMSYSPQLENSDIYDTKPSKLGYRIYMSNLLNTLIEILSGKDCKNLQADILSESEISFDDRYCEFIEDYLSHESSYIDYLGCVLIFSEASKNDGIFSFLSKHMKSRLLSLVSDTASEIYTGFIEEKLGYSLENSNSLESQVNELQIELDKKHNIISKLKKKAADKFESDKTLEKKAFEKELRSKDSIIKKLTEQLESKVPSNSAGIDISEIEKTVGKLIVEELSDIKLKIESLDDVMTEKLESIKESTEHLAGMPPVDQAYFESDECLDVEELEANELFSNGLEEPEDDIEFNMETLENYLPKIDCTLDEPEGVKEIGYVDIEDDIHYVHYPNGEKYELSNLPEGWYLSDGQFVLTKNLSEFKYMYKYNNNEDSGFMSAVDSFAVVYESNGGYQIDKGNGIREDLSVKNNIYLRDSQIVAVTENNDLFKFYKSSVPSLDIFERSIKAKKHKAYFIKEISEGLAEATEIFERKEDCLLDLGTNKTDLNIEVHSTAIVNECDEICGVFPNIKFYTNSSFYEGAYHSIAVVSGNKVFTDDDGELVPVNKVPENLIISDGQVLLLDEFNNLLSALNSNLSEYSKSKHNKKTSSLSAKSENISIENTALVIGNLSYADSYKQSFAKKGYQAVVIDGFESWSRIERASRSADKIFVVSTHISHHNMYEIKKSFKDNNLLFPKEDGANRLAEYL